MKREPKALTALATLVSLALVAGCAASSDDGDSNADALSKPDLTARFADLRKVKTKDFASAMGLEAMNLGATEINKVLSVHSKYGDLGVDEKPTSVFAAQAEDNPLVPGDAKVKSLTDIKQGLAQDLGENEFPTELAKVRLAHLASGQDKYYVQSGFGMNGALGLSWGHSAAGFGSAGKMSLGLGFKKGEAVEAHVVVATDSDSLGTLMQVNGEAMMTARNFVIPEKIDDIQKMKPGEMFSLKGTGTFAANFGIGVPILVANAGPFAYTIAVSAGLSHAVEGILDVGLVKLDGDEVVIDVGMSKGTVNSESFGITGGWGVNTTCDDGAECLDSKIGGIVKRGLIHQLNGFMKTSIVASKSDADNRLELARMRFHMSQPEVPAAIQHALHGDLRYAQALYSQNLAAANPPVKFDFDMMRASTTTSRSFGAELLGVDIYHNSSSTTSGSFEVQTPDGVQSVLWDSFQKSSGWFQMNSGSKLTAISSAGLDATNPDKVATRANLVVQTVVGDKAMDDDILLDSSDALIAMLAGKDALAPLGTYGDAMAAALNQACPISEDSDGRKTWNESCNVDLIQDETKAVVNVDKTTVSLLEARRRGVAAFNAQSKVSSLPDDYKKLLSAAAELHLTLDMVTFHAITDNSAPGVSFALNYRLDDKALDMLAKSDPAALKGALQAYIATVSASRVGFDGASPPKDADIAAAGDAMTSLLATYKFQYESLASNESDDLPRVIGNKPYVKLPVGIRFDVSDVANVDSPERMEQYIADDKRIRVESISHQRALVGKAFFDGIVAAASNNLKFGNLRSRLFKEQAAAYPLLAILSAKNLEVGFDLGADAKNDFWHKRERFAKAGFSAESVSAHGASVEPITAKMFNLDAMMSH
jgi:hypothetical protein